MQELKGEGLKKQLFELWNKHIDWALDEARRGKK
jgi:hypothetical protein